MTNVQFEQNQKIRLKYLFSERLSGAWGSNPEDGISTVCIRAADIDTDAIKHKTHDLTMRGYTPDEIEKKELKVGDLIIEKSGGGENQPVGRVVLFSHTETSLCSNFLEILRPDKKTLFPAFGAYLMYSIWKSKLVIPSIKQTTGIQNLDIQAYLDRKVELPNLGEQQKVATYLDRETSHIDQLIAAKEKLLTLLEEKRKASITRAVTRGLDPDVKMKDSGVEWLGELPEHWGVKSLKYAAFLKSGMNLKSEDLIDSGEYPVYGGNGLRGYYDNYIHEGYYSLIGRQGALCGNINYANGKFWATEHAVVVSIIDDSDTFYLGELLTIMNLNQYSISAAQPGLSVEVIGNLKIPSPPTEEQKLIAKFIEKETVLLDKLKSSTVRTIELLKERRAALISAAVTGQVEIPEL